MQHNGKEVKIKYVPFPLDIQGKIFGALKECSDYWLIVIDSTRCKLHQRKTLGHELAHLFLDHLDQFDRDIRDIEWEAQKMSWTFYKAYISGLLEDNT